MLNIMVITAISEMRIQLVPEAGEDESWEETFTTAKVDEEIRTHRHGSMVVVGEEAEDHPAEEEEVEAQEEEIVIAIRRKF